MNSSPRLNWGCGRIVRGMVRMMTRSKGEAGLGVQGHMSQLDDSFFERNLNIPDNIISSSLVRPSTTAIDAVKYLYFFTRP
jgi:hypothetical protein